MKLRITITALLLSIINLTYAAGGHELKPTHGGVMVEAKDIDIELVVKSECLSLYLTDHGQSLAPDGGSAKVTILIGSTKKDYELLPARDKFELKGDFSIPKGSKAIVVIKIKSKVVTARLTL